MSNGPSQQHEFTLEDLDDLYDPELYPTVVSPTDELAPLAALVNRTASLCSIEFLKTEGNDVKPHVVFNLKLNHQQSQLHEPFPLKGCRLSMEYGEGGEEWDRGTFMIKALPYMGSSNRANASFDFKVNYQITIKDWIDIFRGTYEGLETDQRTNLTLFKFVVVDTPEDRLMDGCRDFICQCFLRAYHLGIVQGYSSSLSAKAGGAQIIGFYEYIPLRPELGTPDSVWFFDIIDKNFKLGSNNKDTTFTVVPTPMHRGVFLGQDFVRIDIFDAGGPDRQYQLNYVSQPVAQNTTGNNGHGGAPGGDGGAGRGGGAEDPPQGGPVQPVVPPSNGSASSSGSGGGRGGPTGGPTGGLSSNQLGTGAVGGTPTPTNPGMGLAPAKEIGAQTGAPLTSRPKIHDTVTIPPAMTTQTRPPSAQTATTTKVSLAGKRDSNEDGSSSEGNADGGSPLKRTKG